MNKITERRMKNINRDRRQFIEKLGKWGISGSLLRASPMVAGMMYSRFAQAQDDRKFVLIYQPNGSPDGRYLTGGFSSPALSPLAPHASSIAALEMTISKPGNHGNLQQAAGAESYQGNVANGSSVNMQAAKVMGNLTPFRSIQLGVYSGPGGSAEPSADNNQAAGIDRLNGQAVGREWNSRIALQSIFSSAPPAPMPGTGGDTGPSIYAKRIKIAEANLRALDALEAKLDGDERAKLASHREAVENRQRIDMNSQQDYLDQMMSGGDSGGSSGGGSCSAPSVQSLGSPLQEYKAQAEIAAKALSCGLTNVASIQFNETQASWSPNDGTADSVPISGADHHGGNHSNDNAFLPQIIGYMNKGVSHLITRLKAEGIYDRTVVCVISEMGDGQNHTPGNGPITLASGMPNFRGAGTRNIGMDHYAIFSDVFTLLDIQPDGTMVHNYGPGALT
ncbi:DUF1552 domain-containing protein [Marinagarivorans cellulosilyticus]|uniref:DUF1552 domain-containing protein n=1 Tax=Marinagarivorans cellulosilyticus TaxID=2721545 RepID=A0AAN2BKM7_9GAMM|nr:DUF1552 domain-containing protein [Marinagarivorans cellulosilyticus]BCD98130.1 hypothetical protein MARGE09_P2331 [Marinagarivorans cellulosilyticus]